MSLALFLFLKIILAMLCPLWFHINFYFSISVKDVIGISIGIALNLYIAWGSMEISAILSLPIYEPKMSFHVFVSSLSSFINVL